MSAMILPVLLYILEIVKYSIGNKLFFDGKIKGIQPIIVSGGIFLSFIILCNFKPEEVYLISYIAAGISAYIIFWENWKIKIFRILERV